MSIEMMLGMACGAVVGLVLVIILLKFASKNGKVKPEYDERQEIARGKGFKYAFFTLLTYEMIEGVLTLFMERSFADPLTSATIGIIISVAVYVIYCTWKDAYITLNENRNRLLWVFGVLALLNVGIGMGNLMHGEAISEGMLTFRSINFLAGFLCAVVFMAVIVKGCVEKNEE